MPNRHPAPSGPRAQSSLDLLDDLAHGTERVLSQLVELAASGNTHVVAARLGRGHGSALRCDPNLGTGQLPNV